MDITADKIRYVAKFLQANSFVQRDISQFLFDVADLMLAMDERINKLDTSRQIRVRENGYTTVYVYWATETDTVEKGS